MAWERSPLAEDTFSHCDGVNGVSVSIGTNACRCRCVVNMLLVSDMHWVACKMTRRKQKVKMQEDIGAVGSAIGAGPRQRRRTIENILPVLWNRTA